MGITNADIARSTKVLFAHDNKLTFPTAFANRVDSKEVLDTELQNSGMKFVIVSDILGSGKTFLVTMVINELKEKGIKFTQNIEICGKAKDTLFAAKEPIFIDEWDTKAEPGFIIGTVNKLKEVSATRTHPVVLLGDYTLQSQHLLKSLGSIAPVKTVPMEPLGPEFFEMALKARKDRVSESSGLPFAKHDIVSEQVREALVPNWPEKTSANFREVFSTLTNMVEHDLIPKTDSGDGIDILVLQSWLSRLAPRLRKMRPFQVEFLSKFSLILRNKVSSSSMAAIQPFGAAELLKISGLSMSLKEFSDEVLYPLSKDRTFISSIGYPEIDVDAYEYDRYPEPYLPGLGLRAEVMVSLNEK